MASRNGSTGAVLRDENGGILAAVARKYTKVADVLMVEALAARDGVLLAVEQGARKVILESDNVTVNTLLRSDDGFRSAIAEVWQEIRELSLSFISFVCKHVNLDLRKKNVNLEGHEAVHLCVRMPSLSVPVTPLQTG
jgi:hypothetical protein